MPAVARLDNGYLLELPPGGNQPLVEALATRGRWVIVTVVDPAYDLAPFRQVSSPFVDSVEIARFPSAVQLSFRFREDILQVSVASQPSDPSILISVFTR